MDGPAAAAASASLLVGPARGFVEAAKKMVEQRHAGKPAVNEGNRCCALEESHRSEAEETGPGGFDGKQEDDANLLSRQQLNSVDDGWGKLFREDGSPSTPLSTLQEVAPLPVEGVAVLKPWTGEDRAGSTAADTRKESELRDRVVYGSLIGAGTGWAVVAGGWWFTGFVAFILLLCSREYFFLVASSAKRSQQRAPPLAAVHLCSLLCFLMPPVTMLCHGHINWTLGPAAVLLLLTLAIHKGPLQWGEAGSLLLGFVYCGYLPTFWIKLRYDLPPALPGPDAAWTEGSDWTVGLAAAFMAIFTVIAADTGAFLGGKAIGRTKLTEISPKKTWEGAACGMVSAVAMTLFLSWLFHWPFTVLSTVVLSLLVFFASVFGDLYESLLKRDAGVKDSGKAIPGHGGVLDRLDSYLFTGALVYWFIYAGSITLGG